MKNFFLLFILLSGFVGRAQYTIIPDANFEKALIDLGLDSGAIDGRVLTTNVSGIERLIVSEKGITDLTGLEDFLSLKELHCVNNKLTRLDLSLNLALTYLYCDSNQISSLDVTKNTALTNLVCDYNQIKSLDVTKNTALTYLSCSHNQISSLDVTKNIVLGTLICGYNKITNLDVSKNTVLTNLECNNNQIAHLDVTTNKALTSLYCNDNLLTSLNLKNGKNTIITSFNSKFNSLLVCIQVDSKAYFDSNWSTFKDVTANYSEDCSKPPIVAPAIKATGNQNYCSGTFLNIVETVNIAFDSDDPEIYSVYIQISSGYINGQDQLTLHNANLHPSIIAIPFDSNTGILKLTSSTGSKVSSTDFEAAIQDVQFSNSSSLPSGYRTFSISIQTRLLSYLPRNKHFYEYVPSIGIIWTNANVAAASKTYYGLQGYLATLTAADEAQLAGEQAQGAGWIGGSDAATEGVWKWVTGPEAGTTMTYTKWNTGEPNQYLGRPENYAHITASGVGITGSWNDLTNTGDPSGDFQPKGYIVEYGGMVPGDVDNIQISASTTITIPRLTSTTPSSRCGTGTLILQATAIDGSIKWYDSPSSIRPIATGNNFTTPVLSSDTIFYADAGCISERKPIMATVYQLPIVNDVSIIQCDTDLISDGKTLFNLTVNNDAISANYANENFSYYTSLNGANNAVPADLISNELAFENTTPTIMDIWSRITNKITGCHSVAKITLKIPATNINPNYKIPFAPVCDDFLDINGNNTANNNNRDGITTFDFASTKAIILAQLPTNQVYNIHYYKNESDALAEINAITDISNYRNIGYLNSQDIWVRIDSDLENACYGLGPYLTLNVEALPVAHPVIIARQCDDNNDGIFTFDTSMLESDLLKGQTNVTVTYFDSANNPLKDNNGVLITSPFPANFTSTSQSIKAVVTNNTPQLCFDETNIEFFVDVAPQAFSVPSTLTTTCDDEANPIDQDGKFAFDTSTFENTILGGQTGMIVKYFDQNNVLLPSPLPNPFLTTTQNITAKVQNPLNTICSASTTLSFVVKPVPNIDLNMDGLDNELVCQNILTFFVTLDAGILDGTPTSDYNYIWTKDGINTGSNSPTLEVNTVGDYTVEVTNNLGCSRIRPITVTASNIASIVSIDVVDLADNNTVTVNVTGPGNYQYSIDEPNGFWQDSNFFNNVPAGIHVVYVNDKNGCGSVHQEIVIVGVPKFFTPNGDGYNDYWSVKGVNETFNSKSIIYIFDRYGKLLKQWVPSSNQGWDGTFNGVPLPADDYWFTLKLEDGRETKGHFSLKR